MPRPSASRGVPRRFSPARVFAGLACLTGLILTPAGCQGPSTSMAAAWPDLSPSWPEWASFRSQSPDEAEDRTVTSGTSLDTPLVGEYVSFAGLSPILVQGVGLVTGLDKTGEDPPPSHYRALLVDEMKRRGVTNPNEILAKPSTALVIVRAYLPPIVRKGDKIDVQVLLPPSTSATSLAGGHLLETRLAEQMIGGGRILSGDVLAVASGPILVAQGRDGKGGESSGNLRSGRILGGGESKLDRDLSIFLRNEYRSGRMTVKIAQAVGKRFHGHDRHGVKVPMAEPKDDQKIVLKVPTEYRDNYPRYLQVVRNIAFRETEVAQRVRMQKLEQQLREADTCEVAALRLEAIGPPARPLLKRGLKNADPEVRFNAALALTYMGEPDGLEALARAARDEDAFRVYAFAAMSASREAESSMHLKELLGEPSAETRYGAFRALTVLNAQDPDIAGETTKGGYTLHAIDAGGPPLVHITHFQKAEVVLFGADQELKLPAVLRAGPHILVAAPPGSDMVSVSRYTGGRDERKTVPPRLIDVLRACDELGATYPDVAALLAQADRQRNLAGAIAIDALPKPGRTYVRPEKDGKAGRKRTIGDEYNAPNIYRLPDEEAARAAEQVAKSEADKLKDEKKPAEPPVKRIGMDDSGVRPVSGEGTSGGVVTAGGETPARKSAPPAELPSDDDAAPLQGGGSDGPPSQEGGPKWYDPRRIFSKPSWAGGGPPSQAEPGAD